MDPLFLFVCENLQGLGGGSRIGESIVVDVDIHFMVGKICSPYKKVMFSIDKWYIYRSMT